MVHVITIEFLQVLVKEHETLIEGLKIENLLNKNNGKDYEKKLADLQKENETILKHLCLAKDIVFGKSKCILCSIYFYIHI